MVTISVCMIVKNEEKVLKRCLDSLKGLYEELIIVDTGSEDATRSIALSYTDKVYDFKWINDFSAARNFAMSKATKDYVYTPDADEILDSENRERFKVLKENLIPSVEIVEMWYVNQLANGTVYNYDRELRPKLYKRLREFTFIEPVHEMVRLDPVVYESDIEIIHKPESLHASRDIKIFEGVIEREHALSPRLTKMYARELMISGTEEDLQKSKAFFEEIASNSEDEELLRLSYIVLAKTALETDDAVMLLKYALRDAVSKGSSEICTMLGEFYEGKGDLKEASVWYYNAAFETEAEVNLSYKNRLPLEGLSRIYRALGDFETAAAYEEKIKK